MRMLTSLAAGCALTLCTAAIAQTTATDPDDKEVAYEKAISDRADKIIEPLGLEPAKAAAVHDLMIQHYRDLRAWDDKYKSKLKTLQTELAEANKAKDAAKVADVKAQIGGVNGTKQPMHDQFVRDLIRTVPFDKVNRIKDGMTFNNVAIRTTLYKDLDLTDEQRTEIRDMLIATREQAMDASTSNEKAAMFLETVGRVALRVLTPEQNAQLKANQAQARKSAATAKSRP